MIVVLCFETFLNLVTREIKHCVMIVYTAVNAFGKCNHFSSSRN